ncbi:translation initiation factor IF-2 [Candidatus Micrarchaeota archaeon]|nr:translation initiation factor IF-2 [Candidatus Micrarchaeota archaeon]
MPIRQPIISMLAHVDHGKTTILDKIRETVVVSKEAGAITQHISASEVPADVVKKICGHIIDKYKINIKIPGLLFIDLPGHEAFTSLRERGGSLADMAVLVIDITQGVQQQTVESINILKEYKTPFIVVANKIDLIQGWIKNDTYSFLDSLKQQPPHVNELLDEQLYRIIADLGREGFDSERFDRVIDTSKQISIVPLSAKTGEGLAEMLLLLTGMCQKYLEDNLRFEVKGPAKGSVLEVKEDKELGVTIDAIIYDGTLRKGQEIILGGVVCEGKGGNDGIIITKVRALMKPVLPGLAKHGEKYTYVDKVSAADGVKIFAPNLEGVIAGSPLIAIETESKGKGASKRRSEKEIKMEREEAINRIKEQISKVIFNSSKNGVVIKTDALGSTEALIRMLNNEKIPIRSAGVGKITKKEILEAATVRNDNRYLGVVLSFNTKITDDAKKESNNLNIPIIKSDVVYDLVNKYKKWVDEQKKKDKELMIVKIQWPAKVRVIPGTCFRSSSPCIYGIEVLEGKVKKGYKLMDEEGNFIGEIKAMQINKESIDEADKGIQVAISMDRVKFNKDITDNKILYSIITPSTVDKLLETFGDDLTDDEKKLINETLNIIRKARLRNLSRQ